MRPRTDAERQAARVARLKQHGRKAYTAFIDRELAAWADAQAASIGQTRAQWLDALFKAEIKKSQKANVMSDFWHTANIAFSDDERKKFNKWRLQLWLASDRLVESAIGLDDNHSGARTSSNVRVLHDLICQIPAMENDGA